MTILHAFGVINKTIEQETKKIWMEATKNQFSYKAQLDAKNILAAKFPELGRERRDEIVRDMMKDLLDHNQATDKNLVKRAEELCVPGWKYPGRRAA